MTFHAPSLRPSGKLQLAEESVRADLEVLRCAAGEGEWLYACGTTPNQLQQAVEMKRMGLVTGNVAAASTLAVTRIATLGARAAAPLQVRARRLTSSRPAPSPTPTGFVAVAPMAAGPSPEPRPASRAPGGGACLRRGGDGALGLRLRVHDELDKPEHLKMFRGRFG